MVIIIINLLRDYEFSFFSKILIYLGRPPSFISYIIINNILERNETFFSYNKFKQSKVKKKILINSISVPQRKSDCSCHETQL